MTSLYPSISCDNKSVCDICHFAKQRKLPFNISLSHATSKFELLHFYIWGLITCKIDCLNSLIFIYFRVVYYTLHVFWLVFRFVSGNEGVKSKRIKKEVKRAT